MDRNRLLCFGLLGLASMSAMAFISSPPSGWPPKRHPLTPEQYRSEISEQKRKEIDAIFAELEYKELPVPAEARWEQPGDTAHLRSVDGRGTLLLYDIHGTDALGVLNAPALPCLSQGAELYRIGGKPMRLVHACLGDEHAAVPPTAAARKALLAQIASLETLEIIQPDGTAMRFDLRGLASARDRLSYLRRYRPLAQRVPPAWQPDTISAD
jgi:hypothetical protein